MLVLVGPIGGGGGCTCLFVVGGGSSNFVVEGGCPCLLRWLLLPCLL